MKMNIFIWQLEDGYVDEMVIKWGRGRPDVLMFHAIIPAHYTIW